MQRGQNTYRIALSDILGFMECDENEFRSHIHRLGGLSASEANRAYKIVATVVHSVTPVGVVEQFRVSFYTRLSNPFASQMEHLLGKSG